MMSGFLTNNHDELVARCKAKVALRPRRAATIAQLSNGIPMFIAQLQRTLAAEEGAGNATESRRISGDAGGGDLTASEMGVTATAHGKDLLAFGYSVDQVVHDYGDLCQAITDLAHERDAPFTIDEFRTLNRCLDNAIASAVSSFSFQRDAMVARKQDNEVQERVAALVDELRNSHATASYAVAALEQGNLPVSGSTGTVLKRSLAAIKALINRATSEARTEADHLSNRRTFSVMSLIAEAKNEALLYSQASGCRFTAATVDPALEITGNHVRLLAALENLLQNAFRFTEVNTAVTLNAHAVGDRVHIEVRDHCGGLEAGYVTSMFKPFAQRVVADKSGLGLGLAISRASVEADGGTLTVQDLPTIGCIFTISLPRHR